MHGLLANEAGSTRSVASTLYDVYKVLVSLKAGEKVFHCMPYVAEYRAFGVLLITLKEMLGDVANFSIFFLLITIAFNIVLIGMQYAGQFSESAPESPFDRDGAFQLPWWAVFGEFDPSQYDFLVAGVVWIYNFFASIVLVNLLVNASSLRTLSLTLPRKRMRNLWPPALPCQYVRA